MKTRRTNIKMMKKKKEMWDGKGMFSCLWVKERDELENEIKVQVRWGKRMNYKYITD